MKLFSTLFVLLVLALPAFGQSSNRRSDSLTNLLATINPTVVATGSKVTYDVYGYYAFGDWGGAREFTLTTNIGALTTNLAHVIRSPVNTNWYWVSADQNNDDQDPRWWGADGTGSVDSTANIQAAVNYSPVHHRRLYLPPGQTFKISQPILFETGLSGSDDYMAINVDGNNSTLISYAPVNIFALKAQSIFYGKIQDVVFTYDQTYTNSTAHNVISLRGDPTGPNYYNIYNVSFHNLTFLRGYYAIKQEEWCSPWGNDYRRWFVSQEMVGGAVDFSPTSNFGNVNNVFESIYVRADMMAGPVFKIKNQNSFAMKDIELNVLHDKQAMLLTASSSVNIQNWRMEVGSFNNAYDGLFQFANVTQLIWDNLQIQSFDLDAPAGTWNYIIRDVGSGPAVNTSSLQFNNLYLLNTTKTNAASYLAFIYSPYQRYALKTWDSSTTITNAYVAYPFGAPATNVQAQVTHRSINDLPTLPGEFAFDTNNWPYISTGIGSTTNWLRLGNSDVFGPASSTDNAVVRFDGTTGKRIQNSLLTLDDSGNINTPGQLHVFGPGYGNPIIRLDGNKGDGGPASGVRAIDILSAGTLRWRIGGNSTTETNINNTGSDFELQAYNSNGVYLYTVWRGERNTGKFQTYGDIVISGVGSATAPSIGENTGSPEGSITANPGSLRLDKNGNVWLKDTGTGNTGWIQLPESATVYAGGVAVTNFVAGTNVIITAGSGVATINATATPYTSFWADLTNALVAGANVTITPNSPSANKITIASSGSGGGTNLWQIGVDGALVSSPNLADSTGIAVTASGTNVTYALVDRDFGDVTASSSGTVLTIDGGAVTTNKIDTTFYDWVNSKGGSFRADGTVTTNMKSSASIRLTTTGSETTLSLSNTTVSAGSYTLASITVDAQGRITAASNGAASTNSGTVVSVNGAQQGTLNLTNSAEITAGLSGTNLSYSIASASIATNKINSVFYDWINGKGSVSGNNNWTGTNTFTDLGTDTLRVGTLVLTNDLAVDSGGTGTNSFPLYAVLYGNTTNPIGHITATADRVLGWDGSGVPVKYTAGSGISISGGQISATGAATVTNSPVADLVQRVGWSEFDLVMNGNVTPLWTNVIQSVTSVGVAGTPAVLSVTSNSANGDFSANYPVTVRVDLPLSGLSNTNYWIGFEDVSVTHNATPTPYGSTRVQLIVKEMTSGNAPLIIGTSPETTYSIGAGLGIHSWTNRVRVSVYRTAIAGGQGGDVISWTNNTFTGSNTFSGAVMLGTTNLATEIALKAPLASPALTGDPTAPTQSTNDNDTSVATTAFVRASLPNAGGRYVLYMFNINSLSPADATVYYTGDLVDPTTTWSRAAVPVPATGTVRGWWANIDKTTGTAENVAMMLRLNDTTDFGGVTNAWDSIYQTFASTNLSQSVTAGDTLAFKFLTPTWVTNPSGMRMRVKVLISQ